MSTTGYHPVSGLQALENGLTILRRSQLMMVPEFKSMYGAIERHHRDMKLAHLTGKTKDLQNQATRDTQFYNILVKMLCEVNEKHLGKHEESLLRVHTWYTANKHVLNCGPQFGKEHLKEEVKAILNKATTEADPTHSAPARKKQTNNKQQFSIPRTLGIETYNQSSYAAAVNSPESMEFDLGFQHGASENNLMIDHKNDMSREESKDNSNVDYCDHSTSLSSPQTRPKTAITVKISPSKVEPCKQRVIVTPHLSKKIHPITSLVNPHATLAKELSPLDFDPRDEKDNMTRQSVKLSRPASLQAWQVYNKIRAYGQDVIGRLSFVGRSGTSLDVRYTAHEHGESPEMHTLEFIKHYALPKSPSSFTSGNADNIFVQQSFETFYQTTDNMRPTTRNTTRTSAYERARSAPAKRRDSPTLTQEPPPLSSEKNLQAALKLCHQLEDNQDKESESEPISVHKDTGVRLDSVINVIDSVTEDMAFFKEKLAPKPQPGFRQPSAIVLPTSRDTDTTTDLSCATFFADHDSDVSRPYSALLASQSVGTKDDQFDGLKKAKAWCSFASAVDWRGRIQPEPMQYQWSKTKFRGHTYEKKWHRVNLSSAGSVSTNPRPKTAPITAKEKKNMEKAKTKNTREDQEASSSSMVVDQEEVDRMMQIQHLLPGKSRSQNIGLLPNYNVAAWKSVKKNSHSEPPPMEFVSFITPLTAATATRVEPKSQVSICHSDTDKTEDSGLSDVGGEPAELVNLSKNTSQYHTDEDSLNSALREEIGSLPPRGQDLDISKSYYSTLPANCSTEIDYVAPPTEKKNHLAAPSIGRNPTLAYQSDSTQLSRKSDPGLLTHEGVLVERSAGRMPSRTHSTSVQISTFNQRSLRTPPSIPTPQTSSKKEKRGQILLELEHHARKTTSPRNFLRKVEELRSTENARPTSSSANLNANPFLGTSLQICKLPVTSRGRWSPVSAEYNFDRNRGQLTAENQAGGSYHFAKAMTAPVAGYHVNLDQSEDMALNRNGTFCRRQTGGRKKQEIPSSIARIGRPIAQVSHIPDPDVSSQAVQIQKEAAAAVDIQRIFRGYMARNIYKSLQSQEILKREEERKAAIRIQSMYRGHLARKKAIYNRPLINPELMQWSKDIKGIQSERAARRQMKMENIANEMNSKHKEAVFKMALIGPHVEIYDIYHPKKTGHTKQELTQAAIKIQKVVRGWMVRIKMEKLARKAIWCGSSFLQMVKDYKSMLRRVQHQHGIEKAVAPFSIKDMNDYMDLRRCYESIFEKRSFVGELELGDIEAFFRECDLHPSKSELEEAVDVTTHGQMNKRDNQALKKKELLDMIFYLYVPPATGLSKTRQSTWMNPIIDGQEAKKLLGSEFVEPAPLAPCAKLVFDAKRKQRQKEQAQKEVDERRRIEDSKQRKVKNKQITKKARRGTKSNKLRKEEK